VKTIEDLARHVNALNLAPGQEYRIDVPTYEQLAFNSSRYEMRFQELDTKLAAGLVAATDVFLGVHHVVICRRVSSNS
jgi:hypothetical protein